MKCRKCGKELSGNLISDFVIYCPYCGESLLSEGIVDILGNALAEVRAADNPVETVLAHVINDYLAMPEEELDPNQLLNVALAYHEGHGSVECDFEKAAHYFKVAAEGGHPFAQLMWGDCLNAGIGVEIDRPEAAKWYMRACEWDGVISEPWQRGCKDWEPTEAQLKLGLLCIGGYLDGGVDKGLEWVRSAAKSGGAPLQDILSRYYWRDEE